jgi:hypothetical protein
MKTRWRQRKRRKVFEIRADIVKLEKYVAAKIKPRRSVGARERRMFNVDLVSTVKSRRTPATLAGCVLASRRHCTSCSRSLSTSTPTVCNARPRLWKM